MSYSVTESEKRPASSGPSRPWPVAIRAVLVTMCVAIVPTIAVAQSDDEARALYRRADIAYAEGRYEVALELFEEAYDLSGRPLVLYSIANTLERLGRNAESIDRLREFLPHASEEMRSTVERRIEALTEREARRREEEEARRLEEERLEERAGPSPTREPVGTPAQPDTTPWGAIALFAVGAAGAGVAIWLSVVAGERTALLAAQCRPVERVGTLCPSHLASTDSEARTYALAADLSWGGVGALLAAATTWLVVDLASTGSEPAEEPAVRASLSPGGVSIRGSF